MQEATHVQAVEAAKDQSLFRDVNEKFRDLNEAFDERTRTPEFICECANRGCVEHLTLTLAEYETIRLVPTHFLVAPRRNHVVPEVERVIEENDRFWVVEKYGDAGVAAIKLDPRSRHHVSE